MENIIDTIFFSILTITGIVLIITIYLKLYVKLTKNNQKHKKIEIQRTTEKNEYTKNMPYCKKYLLTKNEWFFYKELKPIADELGYTILAKVRVADLVEVTTKDKWEIQTYLNKVASKHVDFVIAKPENLKVELLIELDDNSHNEAQKERDDFINRLYKQTGYKLLRTHGTGELKEQIQAILKENAIDEPRPLK